MSDSHRLHTPASAARFHPVCPRSLFAALLVALATLLSLGTAAERKPAAKAPPSGFDREELRRIRDRLDALIGAGAAAPRAAAGAPLRERLLGGLDAGAGMRLGAEVDARRERQDWEIRFHETNGTPVSIRVPAPRPPIAAPGASGVDSPAGAALAFVARHARLFRLDRPADELRVVEEHRSALGHYHVRFAQLHEGVPLWGHDLVVHLEGALGVLGMNGRFAPTPRGVDTLPSIAADRAVAIAVRSIEDSTSMAALDPWVAARLRYHGPEAELVLFETTGGARRLVLAWHVAVRPNLRDHWRVFVDAANGAVLEKYNATAFDGPATARANDLSGTERLLHVFESGGEFFMIDASRPSFRAEQPDVIRDPRGALWTLDARGKDISKQVEVFQVSSPNNVWNDATSVSAHFNAGAVFEYYLGTHQRLGLDGNGATIIGIVHVADENGRPMDNAFWNGALMAYGDGQSAFTPLAGGLDVAAHEFTHGVIQHTVNLEYKFQSGALNESFADVFAAMVDRDDWTIGEDVVRRQAFPTGAMRDLENPHNGGARLGDRGWQPAHMDEFAQLTLDQDNGGVHVNSGIPNRAAALLGNAIGRDKTERIYYRVLDARYLNARSSFVDLRVAALRAAGDLFGAGSPETAAVRSAFDAVGILGEDPTPPPPELPPVKGDEWLAIANSEEFFPGVLDSALFLSRLEPQRPEDVVRLTDSQVFLEGSSPITVSEGGGIIVFVTASNTLHAIASDGSEEIEISDLPVWWSVALAPDASKLAITTREEDGKIYVIETEAGGGVREIELYNPTTQDDVRTSTVRFADALDFDNSGALLVYDTLNRVPQAGGGAIEFWDIHVLDVATETIVGIFGRLPEGISIGNPFLGQARDHLLVFDVLDDASQQATVFAADLFSGETFALLGPLGSVARPKFSPDDRSLVFEQTALGAEVYRLALSESGLEAAGEPARLFTEARHPFWFAIGSRPEPEPPTVSAIEPSRGPVEGGTPVAITGRGLQDTLRVAFGGADARIDSKTAVRLQVATPAAAGEGPVTVEVVTPRGSVSVANGFTYERSIAAPVFTAIEPSSGPAAGGIAFEVRGANFIAGETRVSIGGRDADGAVVDPGTFGGTLPPGEAGFARVRIVTPGGTAESGPQAFYYEGAPVVGELSPALGSVIGGTRVSIRGRGLKDATAVSFGGRAAAFTVVDDAAIDAVTPRRDGAAGAVDVVVQTAHGEATLAAGFRYLGIEGAFEVLAGSASLGRAGWSIKIAKAVLDLGSSAAEVRQTDLVRLSVDGLEFFGCDPTALAKVKIEKRSGRVAKITVVDSRRNKAVVDLAKGTVKVTLKNVPDAGFDPEDGVSVRLTVGAFSAALDVAAVISPKKPNKATFQPQAGAVELAPEADPCP
jgi:Zn-dependent metalloprotease